MNERPPARTRSNARTHARQAQPAPCRPTSVSPAAVATQVLEPNWHVLGQKLRTASSLDELLKHHSEFLDASLRECMLRDAVLLKLLAKLLTICVIFADQTR